MARIVPSPKRLHRRLAPASELSHAEHALDTWAGLHAAVRCRKGLTQYGAHGHKPSRLRLAAAPCPSPIRCPFEPTTHIASSDMTWPVDVDVASLPGLRGSASRIHLHCPALAFALLPGIYPRATHLCCAAPTCQAELDLVSSPRSTNYVAHAHVIKYSA